MRYDDPNKDFGCQESQHDVITEFVDKGTDSFSIVRFNNMLDVLGNNSKTNETFKDIRTLSRDYMTAFKKTSATFAAKIAVAKKTMVSSIGTRTRHHSTK